MSGKPTLKAELTEELMEAVSLYSNFVEDMEQILELLDSNETQDHTNDKIRNEAISFLLKGLEAYDAKDYEGMQKYLHAAIQKLHSQELIDFKDDKPRTDAKVKLSIVRQKTVHNKDIFLKLLEKLRRQKNETKR